VKLVDPSGNEAEQPQEETDLENGAEYDETATAPDGAVFQIVDPIDRRRRDAVGGAYVTRNQLEIDRQAVANDVDSLLLAAILRHESAAIERTFGSLPERLQVRVQGDTASIGPAQMQVRLALELEGLGYVAGRGGRSATIDALLSDREAVAYAAGELHHVTDFLGTLQGVGDLSHDQMSRLTAIGYNEWLVRCGPLDSLVSRCQFQVVNGQAIDRAR
jgi:hypothetical protein